MTIWHLIKQSIKFHWRTHLGVLLGVAVSASVLIGALIVGDSVRYTLKEQALQRLGKTQLAMAPPNRYTRADLAKGLQSELGEDVVVAPVLLSPGIAIRGDSTARVNSVQIIGINDNFLKLARKPDFTLPSEDNVVINQRMAHQLGVTEDDDILLTIEKASLMSRDAPMAIAEDFHVSLRVTVSAIASDSGIGRFSLNSSQVAPYNAFVPLEWLQKKLELQDQINLVLTGSEYEITTTEANSALGKAWELADAGLEIRELPDQNVIEIRTPRIFLEPAIANTAVEKIPDSTRILTYFVNQIKHEQRTVPYSVVTALNPIPEQYSNIKDDEVIINRWLADDLKARTADMIEMTYFTFGPMRKLEERTASFKVHDVASMDSSLMDPELMPDFPGLHSVNNCRDWEPGIPVDLDHIKDEDEDYWDEYKGTPKVFLTLQAGQSIWGNRFGDLTALRYPSDMYSITDIETKLKQNLEPAAFGMLFQDVRERAITASSRSIDFGQLFLSLSFFLIASALILTGLLFVFGVQLRTEESGTLLSLGFLRGQVQRLLLAEGAVISVAGTLLGLIISIFYTRIVLIALSTVWRGAVGNTSFYYHATPQTFIVGILASIIASLLTIWIASRRQFKRNIRELLSGIPETQGKAGTKRSSFTLWIALVSGISALVIIIAALSGRASQTAAFFVSSALLLICCLALIHSFLTGRSLSIMGHGLSSMGMRNSSRRWGRSLATIAVLACGCFITIAVGANRKDVTQNARKRSSGTGGFVYYGESVLPVIHDLNTSEGRKVFRMDNPAMTDVRFVPMRIHEGEDASCLNLNQPQNPTLMGVNPQMMHTRSAFSFVKTMEETDSPWLLLNSSQEPDTVNAVADQNTLTWSVGKAVGDTMTFVDESGKAFNVRIVGAIASSILQGSLIISEENFIQRYPSESGYRVFLVDAPWSWSKSKKIDVSRSIMNAMQDVGTELMTTTSRLAMFNTVQNTYLSIFQSLGGLALMLGSIGLGIVVARNVMERRSELALLQAVGYQKLSIQHLVLIEHIFLLVMGLVVGVLAGVVAVIPTLRSAGVEIPYLSLSLTLLGILVSGVLWTWLASRLVLRSPLLNALRNE
ncbi:FtsX-like permease family protein [Candidatus Poribacteria bacterium]|nr:FtsX-like permease family protein [Candidatus Poribacteria bacterium]